MHQHSQTVDLIQVICDVSLSRSLYLLPRPSQYPHQQQYIMSDEWSPTIVIGSKAKAAKVTRNTSDLNGKGIPIFFCTRLCLFSAFCSGKRNKIQRRRRRLDSKPIPFFRLDEQVPLWPLIRRSLLEEIRPARVHSPLVSWSTWPC